MKKSFLLLIFVSLGVLATTVFVSASPAEILQPAETVTHNEDLTVNGIGRFNAIIIGKQDVGGVTLFNGTIVNNTTGAGGSNNPVTFGDNVRIDGLIYAGGSYGPSDIALKIADSMIPGGDNYNDLGSSTKRWRHGYFAQNFIAGAFSLHTPKTYYYSVPGNACSGRDVQAHETCNSLGDDFPMRAYWSVDLPDGAIVTSFDANLEDNDAVVDMSCDLQMHKLNWVSFAASAVRMASVATTGSSATFSTHTDNTILSSVIDNNTNNYSIVCDSNAPAATTQLHMSGFRITYTKSIID